MRTVNNDPSISLEASCTDLIGQPINELGITATPTGVSAEVIAQIDLPSSAAPHLSFKHYVATEAGWDGGNVKVSVNDGPFDVVPAGAYVFNAPTVLNPAVAGNTNPLAGQEGFTGTDGGTVSGSWGQSQIDLTMIGANPGDTIEVRFDFGMDGCGNVDGWYVDDVSVTTCKAKRRPRRFSRPGRPVSVARRG